MKESINLNELIGKMPEIKNISGSKTNILADYIAEWIENNLKSKKIKPNYLMPLKSELANIIGVSSGTIQNVYRILEDRGIVQSKQCVGTMISTSEAPRKLTSKRELAIDLIKKFIVKNKFKLNQELPSSRQIAKYIGTSPNTTRLALENLIFDGIIGKINNSLILKNLDFEITNTIHSKTLVKQIQKELRTYISKNLKIGDKIPSHNELTEKFKVSVKTIHDALDLLVKEGIILARRGRYGTSVIKMPNENRLQPKKETSIFASSQQTAFYHYERTQNHIKNLIIENYDIGSKLPSIMELSNLMDVSPNTIRKAFENLAKDGYLSFSRGRYGGTFVIDIPESPESQAFKWLAVNPKYAIYQEN